jgi:hypothetical protein
MPKFLPKTETMVPPVAGTLKDPKSDTEGGLYETIPVQTNRVVEWMSENVKARVDAIALHCI